MRAIKNLAILLFLAAVLYAIGSGLVSTVRSSLGPVAASVNTTPTPAPRLTAQQEGFFHELERKNLIVVEAPHRLSVDTTFWTQMPYAQKQQFGWMAAAHFAKKDSQEFAVWFSDRFTGKEIGSYNDAWGLTVK